MTLNDTCASCDTQAGLTPQGLCELCRDELRFIVRPAAHREAYRRRVAAEAGLREQMVRLGAIIITSVPNDNSLWICDLCNSQIPVDDEFTLIPLLGSHALCTPCVTTIAYWPDGWTQPAPRACRCGACQTPLLRALDNEPRQPHREPRHRGFGR
ncbi:MAG: hypothetical protein WD473_06490 [Acidimicrobiia bacterium]